jgi:hypothetical protein
MKFEYKNVGTVRGRKIERPIIPILIRNPRTKQSVGYEALVDSGSDNCIFSAEIGEIIGLDLGVGERDDVGGVVAGERRPMYFHNVEISVGGNVHAIRAGCSCQNFPRAVMACWGRADFSIDFRL